MDAITFSDHTAPMNHGLPTVNWSQSWPEVCRSIRWRIPNVEVFHEMNLTIRDQVSGSCVRRDFMRVGKGYPELKDWALAWLLRIRELYGVNRERLRHSPDTNELAAAEVQMRQHVATMAAQLDTELSDKTLRQPCRKVLVSLSEHWNGLTLFVNDSRVPMDNNYGERLMRGPAAWR